MENKNRGLIIPKIETKEEGAEYILGSSKIKGEIINPSGDWTSHLPEKEPQSKRGIETQTCTVYATLNAIETLLNSKGYNVNYSDRYLAIVGKVDPYAGADPHTIAECIRKTAGCLKEDKLPFSDDIKTPEDYYNVPQEIIAQLLKEGQEWWNEWDFSHEWIFQNGTPNDKKLKIQEALQKGTVCSSVYAWKLNDKGQYYKEKNDTDNHWIQIINASINGYTIFDSYDTYFKDLDPLYDFSIAKVYYLNKSTLKEKLSLIQQILNAIAKLLPIFSFLIAKKKEEIKSIIPVETPIVPEPIITPIKLDEFCYAIQRFEGWNPASRSFRNNNPGNIKYTSYTKSLGAIGHDKDNFCIFPDYQTGYNALKQFVIDAGNNRLKDYHNSTILSFFEVYSDNSLLYAKYVSKQVGLDINTKISQIING